jgi:hypothetical protein
MNVKLLRRVAAHIKAEPRRWTYNWAKPSDEAPCGTQACIAGWAIILGCGLKRPLDKRGNLKIPKRLANLDGGNTYTSYPASKLLQITPAQAKRLFIYWPKQFTEQFSAEEAIARIEHFIKTDGRE